jgi:hypothetical protein
MSNRRRLRRESLEVYLVHLILAYRPLILIFGLALLVYAIAAMFINPLAGYAILLPAIFLHLLKNSFNIILYMPGWEPGLQPCGAMKTESGNHNCRGMPAALKRSDTIMPG